MKEIVRKSGLYGVLLIVIAFLIFGVTACEKDKPQKPQVEKVKGLGLLENDVVDSYLYLLARYLVIRQERVDIAEEGVDYNVIKYNELGKAEFVNPNLDVAYLEAWVAVDEIRSDIKGLIAKAGVG